MTYAIMAACLWVITAWLASVFLTPAQTWPAAYVLILVGLPILMALWITGGPVPALIGFATGCLVLRWPLIYLGRWIKKVLGQ